MLKVVGRASEHIEVGVAMVLVSHLAGHDLFAESIDGTMMLENSCDLFPGEFESCIAVLIDVPGAFLEKQREPPNDMLGDVWHGRIESAHQVTESLDGHLSIL